MATLSIISSVVTGPSSSKEGTSSLSNENRGTPTSLLSNAEVNKMKKVEIQEQLKMLHMNDQGNREVLAKRLKSFYKKKRFGQKSTSKAKPGKPPDKFYDFLCVVDFECTCGDGDNSEYPHEIIEFPIVLIKTSTMEIVDEFHSFCRPIKNPILSDFCKRLTGISQETVDKAPLFTAVLEEVYTWLKERKLAEYRYAFLTDGPWDLGRFIQLQFQHLDQPIPHDFRYWINLRKTFCQVKKLDRVNLNQMLNHLDLTFQGHEHSGIDDARNIARIVLKLLSQGVEMRVNERMIRRDRLHIASEKKQEIEERQAKERKARGLPEPVWKNQNNVVAASDKPGEHTNNDEKPKHGGQFFLPYKVVGVTKPEFMLSVYEDCLTCDECSSGEDDQQKVEDENR